MPCWTSIPGGREADRALFEYYVKKLCLCVNARAGIFFSPEFADSFPVEMAEGVPVDSLESTIVFMRKRPYDFVPALEMVQRIYGKKVGIRYKAAA